MERPKNRFERHEVKHHEVPGPGDWCYEKIDGKWQQVLLPELYPFVPEAHKELNRRIDNTRKMLEETEAQWKLRDESVQHNEGILRDHQRYPDLFIKWAVRYLEKEGRTEFSGRIHPDEGGLYAANGTLTNKRLVNEVANGREWVDENIELELRISEGFVDITHNEERQKELGIEPSYSGWWTQNEI